MNDQDGHTIYHYDYAVLPKLRAMLASYLGHLNKADSYQLKQAIFQHHDWLGHYFAINEKILTGSTTKVSAHFDHPKLWHSIHSQYGYYIHQFPGLVVLFQVGRYYEFYHALPKAVVKALKIKPLKKAKRDALFSFLKKAQAIYISRLLHARFSIVIINETDRRFSYICERLPTIKIINHQETRS